jgi:hypothetical protein
MSDDQIPFDHPELVANPEPRCACMLLLDTSGSMRPAETRLPQIARAIPRLGQPDRDIQGSQQTLRWREPDSNHRFRVTRPRFQDRLMSPLPDSPPTEIRREREPTPRGCRAPSAGPMVRIRLPPAKSRPRTSRAKSNPLSPGTEGSDPALSSGEASQRSAAVRHSPTGQFCGSLSKRMGRRQELGGQPRCPCKSLEICKCNLCPLWLIMIAGEYPQTVRAIATHANELAISLRPHRLFATGQS